MVPLILLMLEPSSSLPAREGQVQYGGVPPHFIGSPEGQECYKALSVCRTGLTPEDIQKRYKATSVTDKTAVHSRYELQHRQRCVIPYLLAVSRSMCDIKLVQITTRNSGDLEGQCYAISI